MANEPKAKGPVLRYVDRPEISEAFADSIEGLTFDGSTMRIEFTVIRFRFFTDLGMRSNFDVGRGQRTDRLG